MILLIYKLQELIPDVIGFQETLSFFFFDVFSNPTMSQYTCPCPTKCQQIKLNTHPFLTKLLQYRNCATQSCFYYFC